ncbi:MAG: Ig-like domain-containing protein [Gemmatimonadota bacterium]|nr:Ig-like domain-containing protein [Gemmatimonadota bacterium]
MPLRTPLLFVVAVAFSLTCVVPTDKSGDLRVELSPLPTLLVKDSVRLAAVLMDAAGDTVPAVITYSSSDATVLNVDSTGLLRAVGTGTATLTIRAVAFESAAPAVQVLRVRGKLEVDSVRPMSVRFGDSLEIFGVGLEPDSLFSITLGGVIAQISGFFPADSTQPEREGMLRVWVPPPAPRRATLALLGFAGGLFVPDSFDVAQRDLYEFNDTVPWALGPLPNGIFNPALALEPRFREDGVATIQRDPTDWYTFTNTAAGDRTIVFFSSGAGAQAFGVFLTDSLWWSSPLRDFRVGSSAWTVGLQTYLCGGRSITSNGEPVRIEEVLFPLSIIAIRGLPAGTYHILAPYVPFGQPSPYELLIANSYLSVLPPDAAEENDYCDVATPILGAPPSPLTIDNPHDIDWFTFTVGPPSLFSARVTASHPDADLDLYLVRDFRPDSLPLIRASSLSGQVDSLSALLPGGNYFLIVVDFPGQSTQYALTTTVNAAGAALRSEPAGAAAAERDADLARLKAKRVAAAAARPALSPAVRALVERARR